MQTPWTIIIILLVIGIVFIVISSLFVYYSSKWLVKWLKNVKRIDDRRDLDRLPKLKEIVRIVRTVSRIYKIKMPEVGLYNSNEVNAFATGPAGDTLIAFSTNLIKTMTMEEIRGVVGHELSHLIHYDIGRILLVQGVFDVVHLIFSLFLASWLFQPSEEERRTGQINIFKWFLKLILFQIISGLFQLMGVLLVMWYSRKRELAADVRGAKITGVNSMLATLRKLLALENQAWVVDGVDLTEDENMQQGEPNSISLLKFNPEKKKKSFLDLFRSHPTLEERILRLEKLKKRKNIPGII